MKAKKKWLRFIHDIERDKPKTKVWNVMCGRDHIGDILYYNHWRQYIFAPLSMTIFHDGCLNEISAFLTTENEKRKK